MILLTALTIVPLAFGAPQESKQNKPGPFVNVYRDDAVAFQVRRDRIRVSVEGVYTVWLRWLWAEPQPWKSGTETARITVSNLDCKNLRVRDLAILHKDAEGKILEAEEFAPEESPWKSFAPETGASSAMARLCQFLPELARAAKTDERKK